MSSYSSVQYTQCPCCHSLSIQPVLTAVDHTVSGEAFAIWHCAACTNRFTQAAPDAASIGPYYQSAAYVSHSDTQKGLINRLYHLVRNYTLQGKRRLIERVSEKRAGSLLDIGAGTGAFAQKMKQAGWTVTGLEPDETARRNALQKYEMPLGLPADIYQLPSAAYDVITLWHVLEHVHDLQGYFERFRHLLKPNGKLLIAVPNYTSYDATLYNALWAAYDVPRHLYHFSPEGMEKLGRLKGFQLESLHPMWFDSFYVSMLSEQYRGGSLPKAIWNGMCSNWKALSNKKRCSSLIYIFTRQPS